MGILEKKTGRESDRTTRWIREAVKIRQEGQDVVNRDEESPCCLTSTTYYFQRLRL